MQNGKSFHKENPQKLINSSLNSRALGKSAEISRWEQIGLFPGKVIWDHRFPPSANFSAGLTSRICGQMPLTWRVGSKKIPWNQPFQCSPGWALSLLVLRRAKEESETLFQRTDKAHSSWNTKREWEHGADHPQKGGCRLQWTPAQHHQQSPPYYMPTGQC